MVPVLCLQTPGKGDKRCVPGHAGLSPRHFAEYGLCCCCSCRGLLCQLLFSFLGKIPGESILREGEFIWLTIGEYTIMVRKAWQQEWEAPSCVASTAMKQREGPTLVLSSLSPFHTVQDPAHGMVLPTFKVALPTSVYPIQVILHRLAWKLVS